MSKEIPVSVIIPCYNCTKTIKRALDSVENQTLLPKDIYLIDDNYDKKQADYLFKLSLSYDNLKIYLISHIQNFGAPSARNTGWNLAKSDYVAFLDADDSWHTQKLELQYIFMKSNNDIYLTGHNVEILEDTTYAEKKIGDISYSKCSKLNILTRNIFPTPTLMIKNNYKLRFDESMRYVDDHLLLMNIILEDNDAYKIQQKLAIVHKPMYGSSGLSSNMYLMEKHELIAYKKIFKDKKISLCMYLFLIIFSILKYLKRLIFQYFR